jgi:hypothetical protein
MLIGKARVIAVVKPAGIGTLPAGKPEMTIAGTVGILPLGNSGDISPP